jgi:magnesium chelatase subunit D
MTRPGPVYPFSAVVGQERMKKALLVNAVDPGVGGVLIKGERGTGKSTVVRALAELLPELEVSAGCRFSCDPRDAGRLCEECRERLREQGELQVERRKARLVELPLNATEDRVAGTIDVEAALQQGHKRFEPGLLALANRSILYIDEVNLLDDHLVDILLDAAAMGVNVVEREGVSFAHPSQFIMIGTMNPEEGELRPQLEDRFGLCVEVRGERDSRDRAEIIRRRLLWMSDPRLFMEAWREEEEKLRERVSAAREMLPRVEMPDPMIELITCIAVEFEVSGHRADLAMLHASLACAALEGECRVGPEHVREAALLALAHRLRKGPFDQEMKDLGRLDHIMERRLAGASSLPAAVNGTGNAPAPEGEEAEAAPPGPREPAPVLAATPGDDGQPEGFASPMLEPASPARGTRGGNGRRTPTLSESRSGKTVGSRLPRSDRGEDLKDIAFDATIRAAAGHARGDDGGLRIRKEDIRTKVRKRKVGNLIIFVVDASASMGAAARMQAAKEAVMLLLKDAYQKRDRVGLITFKDDRASLVLSPTSSVQLAGIYLKDLSTGGATPLNHGLALCLQVFQREMQRDPEVLPLMVLITDGHGNVALRSDDPMRESLELARSIREAGVRGVVLDTARDGLSASALPRAAAPARRIAQALGADYQRLLQPRGEAIASCVAGAAS